MINKSDIIKFLEAYNIHDKYTYHKKSIDKMKIIQKTHIHRIQKKPYMLYGIGLYLLNNIDMYKFILSKHKYKNATYYKINLNKEQKEIFLILIELMESYKSNILKINEIDTKILNKKLDFNDTIYLNIIDAVEDKNLENYIEIKNYYDTLNFLLNIESINMLKYMRFDRLKKNISNNEALNTLQTYNKIIHSMPFEDRDNFIIHGNAVLYTIGTSHIGNTTTLVIKQSEPQTVKDFIQNVNEKHIDLDINVIDKFGNFYTKTNDDSQYNKKWLMYNLPMSDGATDIYEVLLNSKYHFSFLGMKLFNLNLTVNEFLHESSASSMADLLMLYEINGIDIRNKICLPNLTVHDNEIKVFHGKYLDIYLETLQNTLKKHYDKDFTINELKKQIKHCNEMVFDIYKGEMTKDQDTGIIKYFHIVIKKEILKKYASNCKYLLDIGTGKLTDMKMWEENNIKNVVGIEPSIESLKLGEERIKEFGFKGKLDLINGVGDDDWNTDSKYKKVLDNKYDIITFQFTLHYMMNNIKTVISNLKKVMLPKCKIIITCMDGNKIHNDFIKYGHIEVKNKHGSEPIFAIYPTYKISETIPTTNNNIVVYFKGAYGVSNGSIEPIIDIDKLIEIFKENEINLIDRKNFADYENGIKNKLHPNQLRVSSYYMSLIFEVI